MADFLKTVLVVMGALVVLLILAFGALYGAYSYLTHHSEQIEYESVIDLPKYKHFTQEIYETREEMHFYGWDRLPRDGETVDDWELSFANVGGHNLIVDKKKPIGQKFQVVEVKRCINCYFILSIFSYDSMWVGIVFLDDPEGRIMSLSGSSEKSIFKEESDFTELNPAYFKKIKG